MDFIKENRRKIFVSLLVLLILLGAILVAHALWDDLCNLQDDKPEARDPSKLVNVADQVDYKSLAVLDAYLVFRKRSTSDVPGQEKYLALQNLQTVAYSPTSSQAATSSTTTTTGHLLSLQADCARLELTVLERPNGGHVVSSLQVHFRAPDMANLLPPELFKASRATTDEAACVVYKPEMEVNAAGVHYCNADRRTYQCMTQSQVWSLYLVINRLEFELNSREPEKIKMGQFSTKGDNC